MGHSDDLDVQLPSEIRSEPMESAHAPPLARSSSAPGRVKPLDVKRRVPPKDFLSHVGFSSQRSSPATACVFISRDCFDIQWTFPDGVKRKGKGSSGSGTDAADSTTLVLWKGLTRRQGSSDDSPHKGTPTLALMPGEPASSRRRPIPQRNAIHESRSAPSSWGAESGYHSGRRDSGQSGHSGHSHSHSGYYSDRHRSRHSGYTSGSSSEHPRGRHSGYNSGYSSSGYNSDQLSVSSSISSPNARLARESLGVRSIVLNRRKDAWIKEMGGLDGLLRTIPMSAGSHPRGVAHELASRGNYLVRSLVASTQAEIARLRAAGQLFEAYLDSFPEHFDVDTYVVLPVAEMRAWMATVLSSRPADPAPLSSEEFNEVYLPDFERRSWHTTLPSIMEAKEGDHSRDRSGSRTHSKRPSSHDQGGVSVRTSWLGGESLVDSPPRIVVPLPSQGNSRLIDSPEPVDSNESASEGEEGTVDSSLSIEHGKLQLLSIADGVST